MENKKQTQQTQQTQNDHKNQITEILNEISQYEGTLLERILEYVSENELNPQEVGDILSEDENFKDIFYFDLVSNNEIIDKELKETITKRDVDVW